MGAADSSDSQSELLMQWQKKTGALIFPSDAIKTSLSLHEAEAKKCRNQESN
jgi:hypothetical protein